jgi:hypothetical protein
MKIHAIEFETEDEAMQHAAAIGWDAVLLEGKPLAVSEADTDRMAAAGTEFAYLCDHKGRIVTVPVN